IANWASDRHNKLTRPILEKLTGVDRRAALPKFHGKTFAMRARRNPPAVNAEAPALGRKAVLYATCFANYNNPAIGTAAQAVLARNGVQTEVVYPACCGMPQLEQGNIARVAESARKVAAALVPYVERGYDVIALVPSCALMLKFEWPLILAGDAMVKRLSRSTFDISEYVLSIARKEGLAPGLAALDGAVGLHIACHARAQNMGQKAAEMLRLIPGAEISVVERCSGHGGSWGVMTENFDTAVKVGKPVARQVAKLFETRQSPGAKTYVASECPLAGDHIMRGLEILNPAAPAAEPAQHPIELFARAYGIVG
ncbi:MAG: glycerol-3-phosphate dehydrogenase, partial [Alphaproteobacteria bacterium]|nr:glycerol-3-phosphate dehydrogenase [Alphaproteobacteria bacterium]